MSLHTQLRRGKLAFALVLTLALAAGAGAHAAPACQRIDLLLRAQAASLDVASISLLGGRIRLRPAGVVAR